MLFSTEPVKVGIYIGSSGTAIGGADCSAVVLAEAMAARHSVDILQHNPLMSKERLESFADVQLGSSRVIHVLREKGPFGQARSPWRRYHEAREWSSVLSRPYDLFINLTHLLPAFCHAPRGVLIVLFPWFDRLQVWPWNEQVTRGSLVRKLLLRQYYRWEWKKRFNTYQVKTANSEYSKQWTKARWGVDCSVVYPPVTIPRSNASPKNKIILSVGRFTTEGHGKKQLEMIKAFGEMTEIHAQGWEYKSLGVLSERKEDIAYFDSVRRSAKSLPVHVYANVERGVLQEVYRRAQIFWHAAGYEEDKQAHPELQEHFGISTVEAMGAGCVPLAFNGGGQREIIQHGLNGFLWNDLAELKDYTLQLIGDDSLRTRMSESASLRAKSFSKHTFVRNLLKLCNVDPVYPTLR